MEITLRKAALIQTAIGQYLNANSRVVRSIDIPLFCTNVSEELAKAEKDFEEEVEKYFSLVSCRADIRRLIGRANTDTLVSDMLTDVAKCNTLIEYLEFMLTGSSRNVRRRVSELELSLRKQEQEEGTNYHGGIGTPIMTEEMIAIFEKRLSAIKRDKADLQEKIAERNASAKIKLSQYNVDILKQYEYL